MNNGINNTWTRSSLGLTPVIIIASFLENILNYMLGKVGFALLASVTCCIMMFFCNK